eukprot:CAMPEP_0181034722 /NCGR_PEP_ID=MMETSP1070-20121207/7957_1 /TAXON_ID=265543 /ORGANISM="Minutocellus polymorphus, Strain NH13" /LENGTH=431 /DNA_ID=CAMNT_0023112265 /DNA_START=169 /DNA_END=1467 /DNA_ORIENTATION=-
MYVAAGTTTAKKGHFVGIVAPFKTYHNFSVGLPRPRHNAGFSAEQTRNYTLPKDNPYHNFSSRSDPFVGWMEDRHYSAAWLSSVTTLLNNPRFATPNRSSYNPNLEYGTHAAIAWGAAHVFRSTDYFDFHVHHLSQFAKKVPIRRDLAVYKYFYYRKLREIEQTLVSRGYSNPNGWQNGRVLVVMPFHSNSDGHSLEDDKLAFLNLTVKTVSNVFPNIVVSVSTQHDFDYVSKQSGLNKFLFDVVLLQLKDGVELPHFSSVEARRMIETRMYTEFEWVYFTEADQPLFLRDVNWLLKLALRENMILVPHRGLPSVMPGDLSNNFTEIAIREHETARQYYEPLQNRTTHVVHDAREKSCCFLSSTVKGKNALSKNGPDKTMIHIKDRRPGEVQWFRQHNSFAYVAGVCNEFQGYCSICEIQGRRACKHPHSS